MITTHFVVGDRIYQDRVFYNKAEAGETQRRFGTVTEIYNGKPTGHGPGERFLSIQWDRTEHIERNYLGVDLHKVEGNDGQSTT